MQAVIIVAIILGLIGGFLYFVWRKLKKNFREAKNIERGLKMVPMLIHLPPSSEDVDSGSRDARDVTDESISRAQSMYDIIASTATKKGFKSNFYGQRHISFEIVGYKGRVYFYTAVPVALVDVVKQAVVSSYPSARLEEVSEHNIFSPVGKLSGTSGGELVLKESFVHPIATFEQTKRDAIQSILNSLSELGPEDGAGIQILIRPAKHGWSKESTQAASDKRDGKSKKKSMGSNIAANIGQMSTALWKPPEYSEGGGDGGEKPPKQLGSLEQAHVDAIEGKTQHAGYETLIRVVASSNISQRSQSIMRNIVAAFALFDAPGKNGFKFNEARDIENFVTAYIMRFFPQEMDENILNSVELATIFHFPDERSTPTSQIQRQASKQVDGPRDMPEKGIMLGYNVFRGVKKEVRIDTEDRRRHIYIIGQTGTGKSVLLENMIVQDMLEGRGLAFVDPHGDSVEKLMGMVPKERVEDVIYFAPGETDYPMGLNLFEFESADQQDFLIQEAIAMLYRLYDPGHTGIIGPRYEHWFRNAAKTIMADPQGASFVDIPKVFTDNDYAKEKLQYVTDQTVVDFWNKEMASTADFHKSEVLGWFVSKFGAFLSNEMMRNVIGQTKSAFDLREVMDEGKILFVNLSKGRTGELNSKLLGMVFVMKVQAAAMSRANIPEDQRRDFTLYVDEFQNFSTDSFATILSEARKYRLSLVVANQFIGQLTDEIRDAVFGNVGTVMALRTGVSDAEFLVKQFSPTFDIDDLVKIPNFNAVQRLMMNNVPSQPFSNVLLPPLGHYNEQLSDALKRLSVAKYGRPKKVVEEEIFKRLETKEPPRPARPTDAPRPGGQAGAAGAGGSSFLDEWLAKRRKEMAQKQAGGGAAGPKQTVPTGTAPTSRPTTPPPAQAKAPAQQPSSPEPAKPADSPKPGPAKQPEPEPVTADAKRRTDEHPEGHLEHEDEIIIDKEGKISYPNKDE